MSTLADYQGRTVDLLAFNGEFPGEKEQLVVQTLVLPGEGGRLCTGIQKLAQRFLLILLLKKGTRRYRPNDGTTFIIQAEQGRWRTVGDVTLSFYSASLDFKRQMQAIELDTDPLDEQFGSASLLNVILSADSVYMKISLTSKAGSNFTFITPVQFGTTAPKSLYE